MYLYLCGSVTFFVLRTLFKTKLTNLSMLNQRETLEINGRADLKQFLQKTIKCLKPLISSGLLLSKNEKPQTADLCYHSLVYCKTSARQQLWNSSFKCPIACQISE